METWVRTTFTILALVIVSIVGTWQASSLVSPRGILGPTILQSVSPLSALTSVFITVAVASVIGGFVARFSSSITGMFILGFSLFAMALKLEGVEEFVMSKGNVNLLMFESLLLSVIVLLGAIVVFAIGGPLKCINTIKTPELNEVAWAQMGKVLLISCSILPIVWLIANTPAKGQVIGAAAVGGIVIGVLSRQFLQSMQPILLFAFPIAFGSLGYFIGMSLGDNSPAGFTQQEMSTLLFPMPIEYASGAILGLAIGLGWTSSSTEEKQVQESIIKTSSKARCK